MSKTVLSLLLLPASFGFVMPAQSAEEAFQFFAEEAQVVSASRLATTWKGSPATIYVVTSQDIKDSGAQTVWDALRGVPGVDVSQTKAGQGEVSIRGLNRAWNNRTLILLNGRSMLNAATNMMIWESLPVTIQEIDRIEVVEGPASAVYGANAVNGVINIITKSPEKYQGGLVSYTGGGRDYTMTNFDYGRKLDKWSYRLGGGWRGMNKFQRADENASKAGKAGFSAEYAPEADEKVSLSGGLTDMNTQIASDRVGDFFYRGKDSFLDAVYRRGRTKYGVFFKGSRVGLDDFTMLGNATMDSDLYQGEVERTISLPYDNEMVIGTSFQHIIARSTAFPRRLVQDLLAVYFENRWGISDKWSLLASGRADRHPATSAMFSPRASLVFAPAPEQVFRLSAGTSYRNPNMLENYADTVLLTPNPGSLPNPPFSHIAIRTRGNSDLAPERMKTVELAHTGHFGRVTARTAVFYYKLRKRIDVSAVEVTDLTTPPTAGALSTYINPGSIQAWGGEFGLEMSLSPALSSYANYSYQRLMDFPGNPDFPGESLIARQSPRNKVNAGLRARQGGWTGDLQAHWTDITRWRPSTTSSELWPVKSYLQMSAHTGYAFKGRLDGLEAGVSVSNLLNNDHYETLRRLDADRPGEAAEIMRTRWMGTVSYMF